MENMKNIDLYVLVDWQNDFITGSLACVTAKEKDEKVCARVKAAHESGNLVVVTQDTHGDSYMDSREGRALPIPHTIIQWDGHKMVPTKGWELYGTTGEYIRAHEKDMFLIKKRSFGVAPSTMMNLIHYCEKRNLNVKRIFFMGIDAMICVISNTCCFQAAFPEADIIVIPALCDSANKSGMKTAFDAMAGFQVQFEEEYS